MTYIHRMRNEFNHLAPIEKSLMIPVAGTIAAVSVIAMKIFDMVKLSSLFKLDLSFVRPYSFTYLLLSAAPLLGTILGLFYLHLESDKKIAQPAMLQPQEALQASVTSAALKGLSLPKESTQADVDMATSTTPICRQLSAAIILTVTAAYTATAVWFVANRYLLKPENTL